MAYKVLDSRKAYVGKLVTVTVDTVEMPDGKKAVRETVIRGKNAAAVLPIDNDGKIILVRQYRHAYKEMLLEIPAGVLEEGEEPEQGVLRELNEETGKIAEKLTYICTLYPTVGYCKEEIALYLAENLKNGKQNLDPEEFIEIERYTPKEAVEMIYRGEIRDAKTVAAIFAYEMGHK